MGQVQGPAGGERRIETGERIFGKSQRLLCREAPVEDFYAFIEHQKAFFPITWMCQRLGISRASYYRWSNPTGLTPTAQRHSELSTEVAQEFEDADQMAGRDQLTKLLNQRGIKVAAGTVGSIVKEAGLRARRMRAWKKTTVVDPCARQVSETAMTGTWAARKRKFGQRADLAVVHVGHAPVVPSLDVFHDSGACRDALGQRPVVTHLVL